MRYDDDDDDSSVTKDYNFILVFHCN